MAENIEKGTSELQEGMDEARNVLVNEFERQKRFGETTEQTIAHIASIYKALGFRDIISDNHISQQELGDLETRKPSQYEQDYIGIALPYLMENYPTELSAMFEKELGITVENIPETLAKTTIEMKDGQIKTLREIFMLMANKNKNNNILSSVFNKDLEPSQKVQ